MDVTVSLVLILTASLKPRSESLNYIKFILGQWTQVVKPISRFFLRINIFSSIVLKECLCTRIVTI